ncbi:hypothetical protein ACG3SL_13555 [Sphingomonas sp. CJ20]
MRSSQIWRKLDNLFLPLAKKAYLAKLRRVEKQLDILSRRMGLLQMGAAVQLFERVPGLSEIASGGAGAKQSIAAIRQVLEDGSFVRWTNVDMVIREVEIFLADAWVVLAEHDKGRPKQERMFIARRGLKGLF